MRRIQSGAIHSMMETTIEEDLHYLTWVIEDLSEDQIDEIMTKAEQLKISARYYVEEFTTL